MSYASLGDLKSAIRIADTDSDTLLQVALDAATEAIDEHCNRTFTVTPGIVTRYFTPNSDGSVSIDDIYDATGLVISVGGIAIPVAVPNVSAGYTLTPENAGVNEPYTSFYYRSFPLSSWPLLWAVQRANAAVTTDKWGYAEDTPAAVKLACLLQASRWFARRNSPYGIAGSPEMGSELRLLAKLDADVAVMLAGKVRY